MTHDHRDDHHAVDTLTAAIEHDRAAKDAAFRTSPHSPIPAHERAGFAGLAYYPVDPALRFTGVRLQPLAGAETHLDIPTSDGRTRRAVRVGLLRFELDGWSHALTAYDLSGGHDRSFFVPFQDETSGRETYGAGRYLDLEPEADGTYVLDFNLAYHPYCAYSPAYSCPLTPSENRLAARIAAGERLAVAAGEP